MQNMQILHPQIRIRKSFVSVNKAIDAVKQTNCLETLLTVLQLYYRFFIVFVPVF